MKNILLMIVMTWVFWEAQTITKDTAGSFLGVRPDWQPLLAYDTKKECEAKLDSRIAELKAGGWYELRNQDWTYNNGKHIIEIQVLCLPDSIDPRGPKK